MVDLIKVVQSRKGHSSCCVLSWQLVVVWNTMQVNRGGEVVMLAKAHTDVDIRAFKIAFFDDTR